MTNTAQLINNFRSGKRIILDVMGDSIPAGFTANPGPNVWTNGLPYMLSNAPTGGPNFVGGGPLHIAPDSLGYVSQAVQDNLLIQSWPRILRTKLEAINPASKLYNHSASGWAANDHVNNGTVALLATLNPKPQAVIIPLGANNIKNGWSIYGPLNTLCLQAMAADILPILYIPHNMARDKRTGRWDGIEVSGFPGHPDQWEYDPAWEQVRIDYQAVALLHDLPLIDGGNPLPVINILEMSDPYHRNEAGHVHDAQNIWDWLVGRGIRLLVPGRAKPVFYSEGGAVRINTSEGVAQFATGGDGAVSIVTSAGVVSLI